MSGRNSFTPWRYEAPLGAELPGTITSDGPPPNFRNLMDAKRSGHRRTPGADYPDGYLGTIRTRREDRLLDGIKHLTRKSYERGVHKGEKIDVSDYFWPEDSVVARMAGINRQATTGKRHTPEDYIPERLTAQGRFREAMRAEERSPSPDRSRAYRHLLPEWK